ncbi:MAG: hypothetical protein JEZ02_12005 [Desulfatibacillum sp.]|nr:hypothetical protein [Desulfatibacillum sp.]
MKKLLASLLVFFLLAGPSLAHKVNIFAWMEGDTVYTESKFSGGKMVRNGKIYIFDQSGKLLVEGMTNEEGEYSFKVPQKTALVISLDATMGHADTWTVTLDEIMEAMGDTPVGAAAEAPAVEPAKAEQPAVTETVQSAPAHVMQTATAHEIQIAMEKALDKKLKPITRMLVDAQEDKPKVSDILGGIGYIFGLAGLAAYLHYRRKIKELEEV